MAGVTESRSATFAAPLLLLDDRWEPVRCAQGRRVIDVNHARRQVRYVCERCRRAHVVQVGAPDAPDAVVHSP